MMNGICCAYQKSEEQKLREAIRQDIRSEYYSMYFQHNHHENQEEVVVQPIPTSSPRSGDDNSMDGEESVFIMPSINIQERSCVYSKKEYRRVTNVLPTNKFGLAYIDPNLPISSAGDSVECLKNQANSTSNRIDVKKDDINYDERRALSSPPSLTTVSII